MAYSVSPPGRVRCSAKNAQPLQNEKGAVVGEDPEAVMDQPQIDRQPEVQENEPEEDRIADAREEVAEPISPTHLAPIRRERICHLLAP
jgi:hypothetical protein